MTAVVENPAVLDPRKTLSPIQRDALLSIHAFRNQRLAGAFWMIGAKRFSTNTVKSIERMQLIAPPLIPGRPIRITLAGQLAVDKLKSKTP